MMRNIYHIIAQQFGLIKAQGVFKTLRFNHLMLLSLCEAKNSLKYYYNQLTEEELIKGRKTDRVFIFGSGYSLNQITSDEWNHISGYDTIGFNAFVYQKWVVVDYHLVRGWAEGATVDTDWRRLTDDFSNLVNSNSFYKNTIFIVQDDFTAIFAHSLLRYRCLQEKTKLFPYKTDRSSGPPSKLFSSGLKHLGGTLADAINFAYCMGWKRIVLVGVDLYDTRYFWLDPNQTFCVDTKTGNRHVSNTTDRGQRYDEPHSTVKNGIIDFISLWNDHLLKENIQISVYNPKSLLSKVLPIYSIKK